MSISHIESSTNWQERRRYPRYFVGSGLTLAIDDASLQESIGLGEPDDISIGGVRVRNLPACDNVQIGDHLDLLLLDCEDAFTLRGEVVHHATADTFGVEFQNLTPSEMVAVGGVIDRLHRYTGT
ncbi:MAG TPA: PilZ domain-containing protein [Pyrinomonadaceae bacterium]|nr:PilZ domain-containing protein [Pyrinomonadaceae bacterium]